MINENGKDILKVRPPTGYPPEEGRFIRGDDYSPVAVAAVLDTYDFKIPVELEQIVKTAIESGAAIAGSVQTENIGIEKIVANVVANPNIRYLAICGREVEGHMPGEALKSLIELGLDERIIKGTKAFRPYLLNISMEAVERFRRQITTVIDLIGTDDLETIKNNKFNLSDR